MPTLKRADMPGGKEVGSALPRPGSITRIHLTTASTISSLLNPLMLSTSSLTSLDVTHKYKNLVTEIKTDTYNSMEAHKLKPTRVGSCDNDCLADIVN